MANEMRLINANLLKAVLQNMAEHLTENGDALIASCLLYCQEVVDQQRTVEAAPVVHGWWKGYIHSALVRWKDGEPVWADRNVYRCSRCDFGTIAKHNYCSRCGAKMDSNPSHTTQADEDKQYSGLVAED